MTPTEQARDAAVFADAVAFALLAASVPNVSHDEARAQMIKAFTAWPALCRRMEALAELAPHCSAEGQQQASALRELVERRGW